MTINWICNFNLPPCVRVVAYMCVAEQRERCQWQRNWASSGSQSSRPPSSSSWEAKRRVREHLRASNVLSIHLNYRCVINKYLVKHNFQHCGHSLRTDRRSRSLRIPCNYTSPLHTQCRSFIIFTSMNRRLGANCLFFLRLYSFDLFN